MSLIRIYLRVLSLLAPSKGLAWTLALSNLALACTQFAEPVLFGRVVDTLSGGATANADAVWARLLTLLAIWVVVGIFNILCSTLVALYADRLPVLSWWAVIAVLTRAATTLTVLCIIIVGAVLDLKGEASVGEIVTFMNFAIMLIDRLQHAVSFVNRLFGEAPRLREFFDVLDTVPSLHEAPDAIDPPRLAGRVVFRQVSFSYDGRHPAVIDLDFTAAPGETMALVGATGAGKSTALALLHRAFDPQSGAIEIDGRDIRGYTLTGLRRNIGVVFQEAMLFNRSIRENLLVGKPDATEQEILAAVERAQAADFIARAPEGLNARVGERGRMLSGGERQRLSIARALLKDPPIMILDEATSALDSETEAKLMAALDEVMRGRTTFVIAHRLSTIKKATCILHFEAGRIVERGTFEELVRANGAFARLARAQFLGMEEDAAAPRRARRAAAS
jgi:glucan exporter ATP-binding protein